jgi:hypothetical protein
VKKRRKPTPGNGSPAIDPALFMLLEVEWNRTVSFLQYRGGAGFGFLFIDRHDETHSALSRFNERPSKVHAAFQG